MGDVNRLNVQCRLSRHHLGLKLSARSVNSAELPFKDRLGARLTIITPDPRRLFTQGGNRSQENKVTYMR